MKKEGLIFGAILVFLLLVGMVSSWWTPYDSINLRCRYEEMNLTNSTICGNLSMGDTCAEGCTIRFRIIPNQSGYIYFWSSGLPFYFNNNVTINGTMIINNTVQLNVSGNIIMNKNNITEVSSIFVDHLYNNSGGNGIWVHANLVMNGYNITGLTFINASSIEAAGLTMTGNITFSGFNMGLVWNALTQIFSPSSGVINILAGTINMLGNLNMNDNNITNVSNIIGNVSMAGNLNMTKYNITDVDFIFVDNVTGDVVWFHSDIVMEGYDITNVSNVEATGNITIQEYFFGPTIEGNIGSGVIWCDDIEPEANVNLTHTPGTLNIRYPNLTVRIVQTDNTVKYCNITSAWVTVTDDQHSIYYVDNNCAVQTASVAAYLATDLSPGGIADIFNVMAHSGDIEVHKGVTVKNKEDIKVRKNIFKAGHLDVISGLGKTEENFPNLTIGEGEYMYIREIVNASEQNTSLLARVEFIHHAGGNWAYNDSDGLNLTYCDDGTNLVSPCTTPALYRRYYVFITGWADADDHTEIHQLASINSETYTSVGNCLDVDANPLSYTLPAHYTYAAVPIYVYCGRPNDAGWTGSWIDLRTVRPGAATGEIDTSVFLTRDGTRTLIANWAVGGFNISAIDWLIVNIGNFSEIYEAGARLNTTLGDYVRGVNDIIKTYVDTTFLANNTNITYNANNTYGIATPTNYLGKLFVNVINAITGYYTNLYAETLYEAGVSLTSKYLELTDSFGGDVFGTYDNLLVRDTQGLNSSNITSFDTEVRSAMNDTNFATAKNITITDSIIPTRIFMGTNNVTCWGNSTDTCYWCKYFNGTHLVEESPCTL